MARGVRGDVEEEVLKATESIQHLKEEMRALTVAKENRFTIESLLGTIARLSEMERDLKTLKRKLSQVAKVVERSTKV